VTLKMTNAHSSALRINLQLWIPNENIYVKMASIFDTGASKTIIDTELAELLCIEKSNTVAKTITATGLISLPTGKLQKIKIGTQEIHNVPISITKLPMELEVRCVLGMNVLREFLITVDSLNRVITLEKQPLPIKYQKDRYSISLLSDDEKKEGNTDV